MIDEENFLPRTDDPDRRRADRLPVGPAPATDPGQHQTFHWYRLYFGVLEHDHPAG